MLLLVLLHRLPIDMCACCFMPCDCSMTAYIFVDVEILELILVRESSSCHGLGISRCNVLDVVCEVRCNIQPARRKQCSVACVSRLWPANGL